MRLGTFSRDPSHRDSLFRTLVSQLIEHEQIRTTLQKAKTTARITEKVITWAKKDTVATQRKAQGYIRPWSRLRGHLFDVLAPRYAAREGGYTRVHRLGHQATNRAPLAVVELVDSPKDLRRAMTSKIVAREVAESHLGLRKGSSEKIRAPVALLERGAVDLDEEEARKVIESIADRLNFRTRHGLERVLSPSYVSAWEFCRPRPPLPSAEEFEELAEERRTLHSTPEWQRGQPTHTPETSPAARPHLPLGDDKGPYASFLASLRRDFHSQLDLLSARPDSLVSSYLSSSDSFYSPSSGPVRRGSIARALGNQSFGPTTAHWAEKAKRNAERMARRDADMKAKGDGVRMPKHLKALNLKSLVSTSTQS